MPTYRIPEENLDELIVKLEKLQTRAARIGAAIITYEIGDYDMVESKKRTTDGYGETVYHKVYNVTVIGEAPIIDGWDFIAKIEHLPQGNVVSVLEGKTLPEAYRTASPNCDHCQTHRNRNNTFVLAKNGEYKQVGSSCLVDFLGHQAPEALADMFQYIQELANIAGDYEYDPDRDYFAKCDYFPVSRYLAYAAMEIRQHGYVSKKNAVPEIGKPRTSNVVWMLINKRTDHEFPTAQDIETAEKTLDWVRTTLANQDSLSDYEHNLVTIMSEDYMLNWHGGYVASSIVAYKKTTEVTTNGSEYIGSVKERINLTLTVVKVIAIESFYGVSHLHKFVDASGNVFVWFASNEILDEGCTYTGKCTVKEHKEYNGEKQTALTRCKLDLVS